MCVFCRFMCPIWPPQSDGQCEQRAWECHLTCHGVLGVSVPINDRASWNTWKRPINSSTCVVGGKCSACPAVWTSWDQSAGSWLCVSLSSGSSATSVFGRESNPLGRWAAKTTKESNFIKNEMKICPVGDANVWNESYATAALVCLLDCFYIQNKKHVSTFQNILHTDTVIAETLNIDVLLECSEAGRLLQCEIE